MMLYKNRKVKVCSLDRDTDYFDIVAGDTFAPKQFIISLVYVLRTSKENGLKLAKKRSRRYPAQTIMDDDYADDKELRAQDEYLLQSLELQR